MSQVTDNSGLAADLDKALTKARTSATLVIIFAIISTGLVAFWLRKAHNEFVAFTPEVMVKAGAGKLNESLPQIEPQIKQQLVDAAPQLMDRAEAELNQMPDRFATMMVQRTGQELDKAMPQLEDELYKSLKTALENAKAHRGAGISDEAHAKAVIQTLADTYGTESIKLIDELKSKYTGPSGFMLGHLERLADNKGLNRREQLERQALVTFLTMASRAKASGAQGM